MATFECFLVHSEEKFRGRNISEVFSDYYLVIFYYSLVII